jgi:hypothetical protein
MLIISDSIKLTKLIDVLQKYLVGRRKSQLVKQFSIIHQTCSKHQSFKELQTYCDTTARSNPGTIFKADDFTTLDKDLLIFILENEKLKLYEIQKWNYIIEWGIAQTPSLTPNISSFTTYDNISLWTKANFRDLSNTLTQIIPLINLKKITSKDFCNKVKPFKKLLGKNYYDELLVYHLSGE